MSTALAYKNPEGLQPKKPKWKPVTMSQITHRKAKQRQYNRLFLEGHGQEYFHKYRPLIENYTFSASCMFCRREFMSDGTKRGQTTSCIYRHTRACAVDPAIRNIKKRKTLAKCNKDRREERKQLVDSWKEKHGCYVCGERNPYVLDFHHIMPTDKDSNISRLLMAKMERLMAEILKCVVLCKNHHALVESNCLSLLLKVSQ